MFSNKLISIVFIMTTIETPHQIFVEKLQCQYSQCGTRFYAINFPDKSKPLYTGPENIGDVLTLCVSMALEMNSSKRELCSRLIADMYGRVIEPQYMEDAFVALLKQVLSSTD